MVEDRARPGRRPRQPYGREPGVPVVQVHDVRDPRLPALLERQPRYGFAEAAKAPRVVRVVAARSIGVRPALPGEQRGVVNKPDP